MLEGRKRGEGADLFIILDLEGKNILREYRMTPVSFGRAYNTVYDYVGYLFQSACSTLQLPDAPNEVIAIIQIIIRHFPSYIRSP